MSVKRTRSLVLGLALLLALVAAVVAAPASSSTRALAAEPVKLRVEVTDVGFNARPDLVLDVEQGQLVELTFVWAQTAHLNDEHVIVLPGYKLESGKLTAENREVTLKFLADKPGSFDFKCDLDCEAHDFLQRGQVKVKAAGAAADARSAAALTPTRLTLSASALTATGGTAMLMASLNDRAGAPVPKAELRFYVDAAFAGTRGQMEVGRARTDANGVAFFDYRPTLASDQQRLTARFEGMGLFAESQEAVELQLVGVPAPAYTVAPAGLESVGRGVTVSLLLLVVGAWTTFGFVVYQLVGVYRDGRRGEIAPGR